jgi:hypothetical protein
LSSCGLVFGRQDHRLSRAILAQLVNEYLAQHDAEPVTIANLRWLLGKAVAVFGELRLSELDSQQIAACHDPLPVAPTSGNLRAHLLTRVGPGGAP